MCVLPGWCSETAQSDQWILVSMTTSHCCPPFSGPAVRLELMATLNPAPQRDNIQSELRLSSGCQTDKCCLHLQVQTCSAAHLCEPYNTGHAAAPAGKLTFNVNCPSSGHWDSSGVLGFTVKLDATVHTCRQTVNDQRPVDLFTVLPSVCVWRRRHSSDSLHQPEKQFIQT